MNAGENLTIRINQQSKFLSVARVWLESNCLGAQVHKNLSPVQVDEGAFLRDRKGVNKARTSFRPSRDGAVLQEKRSLLQITCAAARLNIFNFVALSSS